MEPISMVELSAINPDIATVFARNKYKKKELTGPKKLVDIFVFKFRFSFLCKNYILLETKVYPKNTAEFTGTALAIQGINPLHKDLKGVFRKQSIAPEYFLFA